MRYGYGHGMQNFGPLGIAGGVLSIIFWILIIILVVALIRRMTRGNYHWMEGRRMSGNKTALDILKERYAKGEINKQEFEEKKKDIEM